MKNNALKKNGIVTTLCRMCNTRCAIDVHLENGEIVDITPHEGHPVNKGKMCPRGGAAIDIFYHPDRILKPLKRRPDGSFVEIPREQALDEIAREMLRIKRVHGASAVGVWKGEAVGFFQQEEYARRFVHAFGSPNYFSNDSACFNGRYIGHHLVSGFWNPFPDFSQADLILLLGTNPPMCHPPFMRELANGRRHGVKIVMIDPRLNPVACYADIFAQPLPGTDGALAWGLIRYLIENRKYDEEIVEKYSVGFDRVRAYAERFTPAYVEQQSGIFGHVVEDIGQLIVQNRPRISIFPGAGLEHHENGVNTVRAFAILWCLCGAFGKSCGLHRAEGMGGRTLTLDDPVSLQDQKPIGADKYPVLYQVTGECHTMMAMDYMLGKGDYPFRGLIVTAANPAVTNPNTQKVEKALSSLDLLVVNDLFMTKTAQLAHYILPAATFLERSEIHYYPEHQLVNLSQRIMKIPGVHDEYGMWHDLAHRLGFGEEYFPWDNEDDVNRWILEPTGVTPEALRKKPRGLLYKPLRYKKYLTEGIPTPSGKLEFASTYLESLGLPGFPKYVPPHHIRNANPEFPFVLTTGARKSLFYHSRNTNIPRFRKIHPEAEVEINPKDAGRLGIEDGDVVRVSSKIGSLEIKATVRHHSELREGVIEIYHGWEDCPVNRLTFDEVNDPISGFPLLKGVPVKIEKITG